MLGSLVPASAPTRRTGGATSASAGGGDEFCGAGPSYLTGASLSEGGPVSGHAGAAGAVY
jgi:hypothetical protein